jgi:hypothetical protein
VAFIINVTDPAVAHEMLEKLPLGKAHMMSFELIPIGPLNFCRACSRNLEICRALLGHHARALGLQSHCWGRVHHSKIGARMSALGQKQTWRWAEAMSALPPKADIRTQARNVRFVPKADSCTAAIRTVTR